MACRSILAAFAGETEGGSLLSSGLTPVGVAGVAAAVAGGRGSAGGGRLGRAVPGCSAVARVTRLGGLAVGGGSGRRLKSLKKKLKIK